MFETISQYTTSFSIQRPWIVIFISLLLAFFLCFGITKLEFTSDYRTFFSKDNPLLKDLREIEMNYCGNAGVIFTIKAKEGDVFNPTVLRAIQELTEEAWRLPFVDWVDSMTNFQVPYMEDGKFQLHPNLYHSPFRLSKDELFDFRVRSMEEPSIIGNLLSENTYAAAVKAYVVFSQDDIDGLYRLVSYSNALADKIEKAYPQVTVRPSGTVMMQHAFIESSITDMIQLVPIMAVVLFLVTLLFIRTLSGTIATMLVLLLSTGMAMGFGGWMGYKLTPPSSITPAIILTLAIADSIHIIVNMLRSMHRGMPKGYAIMKSLEINFQPVFLTSFTTIIGFLALNYSDSPPFWHLGNMTAVGVLSAYLLSIFFLPSVLTVLPMKVGIAPPEGHAGMLWIGNMVVRYRKSLLFSSFVIFASLSVMTLRIEINDKFVEYFGESIDFRPNTEFMLRYLGGIYTIEYAINAGGYNGIHEPEYLNHLEMFADWLRRQAEVDHVYSLSDLHKRLNMVANDGDHSWYHIPHSMEVAKENFDRYAQNLPNGLRMTHRITLDYSTSKVTVILKDISSREIQEFKRRSERWLKYNTPEVMHARGASPTILFSEVSEQNLTKMLQGNILTLITISLTMIFMLKSIKIGIISIIPNFVPFIMGYGLWGMFEGEINMAVAIAAAVSLGVIVDDTIHFLSKYHRARTERGMDVEDAVRYAFHVTGVAIVITTLILLFGFWVLTYSAFQVNAALGLLSCFIIASALLADFFLLAPLLVLVDKDEPHALQEASPLTTTTQEEGAS